MDDKILKVKKEMKSVIKSKGMTRLEKYNLLRERRNSLSKKERKILLRECRRDYEIWDRFQDIKELITVCLTGLGLIFTVVGILFKDSIGSYIQFYSLLVMTGIYVCLSILVLMIAQLWRDNSMNVTRQMIDILEEK